MRKFLFSRGAIAAMFAAAVMAFLIPGSASAASPSSCDTPDLSQPFLSWGDSNWYTPAPGVVPDSFTGTGWVLTGGAHVNIAVLADGTLGLVLDLPPGASATSSPICVDSNEPFARMLTRTVGSDGSPDAGSFYVTAAGSALVGGTPVAGADEWAEAEPANVYRGIGAEMVNLTVASNQTAGDLLVYDLYIDPRLRY